MAHEKADERLLLGVDVGGTKCAGGIVSRPGGRVVCRMAQPTGPERGGEAVLDDVVDLVTRLLDEAEPGGAGPACIGLGVAELVSDSGEILSGATIRWQGLNVADRIAAATGLDVRIDADVRAAARAEAALGAGRGLGSFLYATIGTGISAALVIEGQPYLGSRGLTGTFASSRNLIADDRGRLVAGPPLEQFASGPAIAARFADLRPDFAGSSVAVLDLADSGDEAARSVVESAGRAVGAALAHLVNTLDPEAVVLGGGLGLAQGIYRPAIEQAMRAHIWSDLLRPMPLLSAGLGADSGWIGAALGCEGPEPGRRILP